MKLNNAMIAYITLGLALVIVLALLGSVLRKRKSKESIEARWKENQKLLADKKTWKQAVIGADELLDEVLKRRHFKGKTMGERLVAAQHNLSANDTVWYSHKLRNKIVQENIDVTKSEVKKALLGFWQALKDLEAFKKENNE